MENLCLTLSLTWTSALNVSFAFASLCVHTTVVTESHYYCHYGFRCAL